MMMQVSSPLTPHIRGPDREQRLKRLGSNNSECVQRKLTSTKTEKIDQTNDNMPYIDSKPYKEAIKYNEGRFTGEITWSYNAPIKWNTEILGITSQGALMANQMTSTIIPSLHNCKVQMVFMDVPTLSVISTSGYNVLLQVNPEFQAELLGALLHWKFKRGVFSIQPSRLKNEVMVCKLNVFGNLPKKAREFERAAPGIACDVEEGWFSCMGVFKNAILELIEETDGTKLASIDIKKLARSEVRVLDSSLGKNCLWLGEIETFRQDFNIPREKTGKRYVLEFPSSADIESWYNILTLSAQTELFNGLRNSNHYRLTIIDSDLDVEDDLVCEVVFWDKVWFRTACIPGKNPFWREEFCFSSHVPVDFHIVIRGSNESLGHISITHENVANLSRETKIPIIGQSGSASLLVKVEADMQQLLGPHDYLKLEQMLLNDLPLNINILDIVQSLGFENDWFVSLIQKECVNQELTNSFLRGNSLLTQSMETYFQRIGAEYLEETLGDTIREIIDKSVDCEVDPRRSSTGSPEQLMLYMVQIWNNIRTTDKKLPDGIKKQLTNFHTEIPQLHYLSGFLFLRFFCPVLLNPKMFGLCDSHPQGDSKRTLTLLAKILLNFSTQSTVQVKEPWLAELTEPFYARHTGQLIEYMARVSSFNGRVKDYRTYGIDKCHQEQVLVNTILKSNMGRSPLTMECQVISEKLKQQHEPIKPCFDADRNITVVGTPLFDNMSKFFQPKRRWFGR